MQLLLDESGVLAELEHTSELTSVKDSDKARKASNRLQNLETLLTLAGLQDVRSEGEALLLDVQEAQEQGSYTQVPDSEADSGSSSADSSGSSSGADSSEGLRGFMDFCGLQGDGDDSAGQPREPRVQFLTMHSSKGKEFACVATPAFYEGMLPSDLSKGSPEELEQERNTAYVAVTRAMDRLLITWPQNVRSKWETSTTMVSRFLADVVRLAKSGRLPGVQFTEQQSWKSSGR
jgi:superfamily I DNA/RNA helicase